MTNVAVSRGVVIAHAVSVVLAALILVIAILELLVEVKQTRLADRDARIASAIRSSQTFRRSMYQKPQPVHRLNHRMLLAVAILLCIRSIDPTRAREILPLFVIDLCAYNSTTVMLAACVNIFYMTLLVTYAVQQKQLPYAKAAKYGFLVAIAVTLVLGNLSVLSAALITDQLLSYVVYLVWICLTVIVIQVIFDLLSARLWRVVHSFRDLRSDDSHSGRASLPRMPTPVEADVAASLPSPRSDTSSQHMLVISPSGSTSGVLNQADSSSVVVPPAPGSPARPSRSVAPSQASPPPYGRQRSHSGMNDKVRSAMKKLLIMSVTTHLVSVTTVIGGAIAAINIMEQRYETFPNNHSFVLGQWLFFWVHMIMASIIAWYSWQPDAFAILRASETDDTLATAPSPYSPRHERRTTAAMNLSVNMTGADTWTGPSADGSGSSGAVADGSDGATSGVLRVDTGQASSTLATVSEHTPIPAEVLAVAARGDSDQQSRGSITLSLV